MGGHDTKELINLTQKLKETNTLLNGVLKEISEKLAGKL